MAGKQKPRRVAVTLPEDELQQLEESAARLGLSVSALVRVLVLRALEERTGQPVGVDRVLQSVQEPAGGEAAMSVRLVPSKRKPGGQGKPRKGGAK